MTDAVETIAATVDSPLIQLSCEHASDRMPPSFQWPAEDARLRGTHWASDPGAAEVTRMLAQAFGAPAVLSRFTRLLIDPNRELSSDTLFRDVAEGQPVVLNVNLDPAEAARRTDALYRPYHQAYDAMVARYDAVVVSIHSFTPLYEGQRRSVEVGVLHDQQPELGQALCAELATHYDARDNEPWDGRGGLMFAPQDHATAHGRWAVELELRQDLCTDPAWREAFVPRFERALRAVLARR